MLQAMVSPSGTQSSRGRLATVREAEQGPKSVVSESGHPLPTPQGGTGGGCPKLPPGESVNSPDCYSQSSHTPALALRTSCWVPKLPV